MLPAGTWPSSLAHTCVGCWYTAHLHNLLVRGQTVLPPGTRPTCMACWYSSSDSSRSSASALCWLRSSSDITAVSRLCCCSRCAAHSRCSAASSCRAASAGSPSPLSSGAGRSRELHTVTQRGLPIRSATDGSETNPQLVQVTTLRAKSEKTHLIFWEDWVQSRQRRHRGKLRQVANFSVFTPLRSIRSQLETTELENDGDNARYTLVPHGTIRPSLCQTWKNRGPCTSPREREVPLREMNKKQTMSRDEGLYLAEKKNCSSEPALKYSIKVFAISYKNQIRVMHHQHLIPGNE